MYVVLTAIFGLLVIPGAQFPCLHHMFQKQTSSSHLAAAGGNHLISPHPTSSRVPPGLGGYGHTSLRVFLGNLGKELDEKKGIISDNYQKFPHWECAQEGRITGDKDVWGCGCDLMLSNVSCSFQKRKKKKKNHNPPPKVSAAYPPPLILSPSPSSSPQAS